MKNQNFKVYGFCMDFICNNSVGAVWRAHGFIKGNFSVVDGVFNGYTKKEIARLLKIKLAKKIGFC